MSTRQLRKLQKQRELQELQATNPANDSEESEDDVPIQKAKPSIFSGFAALGDQGDEDEDEDENDDGHEVEPTKPSSPPTGNLDRTETPNSTSKKSKKKKKKGKKPNSLQMPSRLDTPAHKGTDDIDAALRELELELSNKKSNAPTTDQTDTMRSVAYERICELLRINTHHLKVVNEMRNLFGREAIAAALNEENEERARTQRARQMQQDVDLETFLKGDPGKTLPEVTLRRNPFLPGKDTWPRAPTEGLTMRQFKEGTAGEKSMPPGTVEFGFAHDENYNTLEVNFFHLVQQHDPMQLVYFSKRHPYHISTLIQVSKVAKHDQNSALAADLCERALFTFGRVALSVFRQKVEQGKARLDFRRPENRQFWLAGYHYLKNLVMKGTYRTALEWAKLLFSMDLGDPYGMIHFIHPMAIRAYESKWFIDFCDSEALDNFDTAQDYIRQTVVLARLQQKDTAGAKSLLLEGMERLPWLYSSLYKALNLDVPKAIWGMQPRDGDETLFVELYIHQTKSLWDNAQALSLLKEAARDARKPDSQTFGFPPVAGRNVARFVYLDNTPSLMDHVPRGLLSTSPNWEFDPIPPLQEENIFSYDSQQDPWLPPKEEVLRGLNIPRNVGALRGFIARRRGNDEPPEFEAWLRLQDAVGEAHEAEASNDEMDDDVRDEDEGEDESEEPGGEIGEVRRGLLRAMMDIFNGGGGYEGGGDGEPGDDHWSLAESEIGNRMPGAWESDEEDNVTGDVTGDEAPGREPAS